MDIANKVTTSEVFHEFKQLMNAYKMSESIQKNANAVINKNLRWIELNSPKIQAFLDQYLNSSGSYYMSWIMILCGLVIQYFNSKR